MNRSRQSFAMPWLCIFALVAVKGVQAQQTAVAEPEKEARQATELTLASIFSDHMVLQRDMKAPVWGTAEPGAKVTVETDGKQQSATADDDGKWKLAIGPFKAGGPHDLTITAGDDELTLTDVLFGDVWICSGQSNMEWPMTAAKDAETEIAIADWPDIRFVDVPNVTAEEPVDSFQSTGWQACKPENIGQFSAVAYFFARDLHKELNVPIGLIGCNWGGTMMEAWTSRDALESSKTFKPIVEADDKLGDSPENVEAKKKLGPHRPAALFNGMISAVVPYGIRGAIWYQGESNAARHEQYAELSKLMIADWRNRWGQGDFPFLLVQLAAFEPGGDAWPFLREAQAETLEAPNTGMAVAIDIGDQKDIHPRNKQDVGARLALAARHVAYGEDLVYSGPVYREMKAADGVVRMSFDHVGGGLKASGETLKGFQIAGADGKFVPADAKIDGAQVVVSSKEVADPVAVRYNWAAFPDGNLQNAEGLPAVPFRTDKK
jgi:sialate O-acetylesterase